MAQTVSPGFVARNNQVIGSLASIAALIVSVLLGAGLMFGTDTRGVSAILTVLTIAGGTFTLLIHLIGATLESLTPAETWASEERHWRTEVDLPADLVEDAAEAADGEGGAQPSRRLALALAVVAIVVGLSLSVVPAVL